MADKLRVFQGSVVSDALDRKGSSDTQAGAAIGVSARSVANYRAGMEPRSYAVLSALADFLGLTVDDLFKEVE